MIKDNINELNDLENVMFDNSFNLYQTNSDNSSNENADKDDQSNDEDDLDNAFEGGQTGSGVAKDDENQGGENQGGENQGGENQGGENQGGENTGNSNSNNKDKSENDENASGKQGKETPLTKPIRKTLKEMARVAQIARAIELMPKPQDFATKICSDIIYMSSLLQRFVKDLNKMLDGYSDIPFDYLNTQLTSIMTSANSALNKAQAYTDYVVDNTLGLAQNTIEINSALKDGIVDTKSHIAQTVSSFGDAISSTSKDILGDHDTAQSIRDGVEKFEKYSDVDALKKATGSIEKAKQKANNFIEDTGISSGINQAGQFVLDLINKLKSMVDKMTKDVDNAFGNIINTDKLTTNLDKVHNNLTGADKAMASQAVAAASGAVSAILENFSIGKFVSAFLGIATNVVLVKTGLDQLPPINIDKMLSDFQSSLKKDPLSNFESGVTFDELVEYDNHYKDIKASFEVFLEEQRKKIQDKKINIFTQKTAEAKAYRQAGKDWFNNMSKEKRSQIKSAIKDIKKKRKQTKKAKKTKKLKEIINAELEKLKKFCDKISAELSTAWNNMIQGYKDAINEIKTLFTSGTGNAKIDDWCYAINDDCDNIVQLCTIDMPVQSAGSATKAVTPTCFGMAIPNWCHNIISFIVDVKVYLKFIMDLINLVMDILNNINNIARLILNGLNSIFEIIHQLLDLLGLGWLMDLVKDLVDTFKKNVDETCEIFEGSLSPVYLGTSETKNKWIKEIQDFIDRIKEINEKANEDKNSDEKMKDIHLWSYIDGDDKNDAKYYILNNKSHINGLLVYMGIEPIDYDEGNERNGWKYKNYSGFGFKFMDNIFRWKPYELEPTYNSQAIIDALEYKLTQIDGNYIVAYRAPKFANKQAEREDIKIPYFDTTISLETTYDPSNVEEWVYYHPNLNHIGYDISFYDSSNRKHSYDEFDFQNLILKTGRNLQTAKIYYSEIMANAARKPNTEWKKQVIKKDISKVYHHVDEDGLTHKRNDWAIFNRNGDTNLTVDELFYWYSDEVKDDNWMKIKFPGGDYDDYVEPEKEEINLNLTLDINNKTNKTINVWLYGSKYYIKNSTTPNETTTYEKNIISNSPYKLILSYNPNYKYSVDIETGTTLMDNSNNEYIVWEFLSTEDDIYINIRIEKREDVSDEGEIINPNDPIDESDDEPPTGGNYPGYIGNDDDYEPPTDATIVNYSENGSIVQIYIPTIDSNGKIIKEKKLVWVKNKTLKTGDWILVDGRYYKMK